MSWISFIVIILGPSYVMTLLFNFQSFITIPKFLLKRMIHQFKSPIKSSLIHKRNRAWHNPRGGHAPLTEKALLLLKLVWSLPWQKFLQFQKFFQTMDNRVFFWGIYLLPNLIGIEMGSDQNSVKKTKFLQIY